MAVIGYGGKLTVNDGSSQAATEFVELVSFMLPVGESSKVEYTYLSQSTKHRHFMPGMVDVGMASYVINYNKADHARLVALLGKRYIAATTVAVQWVQTLPDEDGTGATVPVTATFTGFLMKVDPMEVTADGLLTLKCEICVDGAITLGTAANSSTSP